MIRLHRHFDMRQIDRVVGSFRKMIEEQRTRCLPDIISIAKDTVSHPTIRVDRWASKNSTGLCLISGRLRVDDGPGLHQLRMGGNQLKYAQSASAKTSCHDPAFRISLGEEVSEIVHVFSPIPMIYVRDGRCLRRNDDCLGKTPEDCLKWRRLMNTHFWKLID